MRVIKWIVAALASARDKPMGGFFIPMDDGDLYITGAFGPVRISRQP